MIIVKVFISICFIILIFFNASFAQVTQEWVQRYNGPANSYEVASKMHLDNAGNVYITGSSSGPVTLSDFVILKYSSLGSLLWSTRFNNTANRTDELRASMLDNSGNIYAAGFSTDSLNNINLTVIKLNGSGSILWSKIIYFPGYTGSYAQSVCSLSGDILVAGTATSIDSKQKIVMVRFSSSGSEIWRQVFPGTVSSNDVLSSAVVDNSGSIYLSAASEPGTLLSDMLLAKYSPGGTFLWEKRYGGSSSDDKPYAMAIDNSGNIVVTGSSNFNSSSVDYTTIKYTGSGDSLWVKRYDAAGSIDISQAITRGIDNSIYITGSSRSGPLIGTEDIATVKYSSSGTMQWVKRFNGAANTSDIGFGLVTDTSNNVYIAGTTGTGGLHTAFAILKYDGGGEFKWLRTYYVSNAPEDFAFTAALDNNNNVFVNGISFDTLSDYDIVTIKYSQTIGITSTSNELPSYYDLFQNYPNPFNPETKINFNIPVSGSVSLVIYDLTGKEIDSYVNPSLKAGKYVFAFNGSPLSSGVYFYRLTAGSYSSTRKMVLLK